MDDELENIFNLSPDLIGLGDLNGYFTKINPAFRQILGYANDEFISQPFLSFVHDEDVEITKQALSRAMAGEKNFEVINRYRCKNGTYKWIEWHVLSISEEHKFYTVGRDVSVQMETELALKESEEKYRLLAEYSPDMIYKMSLPDGTYEYVSPASTKIFGYSPEEWIENPKLIANILPEDWQSYFIEEWAKLLEGNAPPFYEYEINHKDGRRRWMNQRNFVLKDEQGRPNALIGVVNDITDRKSIELKLLASEKHLLTAQKIAYLGSWELDLLNNILKWSDQVFSIFEIDKDRFEASYEGFLNAIHPDDRDMVNEAYKNSIENKAAYSIEHRLLMADGRVKHVLENGETIFDDQGNPLQSIGTVLDISDRKKSEQAVLKAKQDADEALEKVTRVNLDLQHEIALKNQIERQLNQYTHYDTLTTLPNQVSLLEKAKEIAHKSIDSPLNIGCCFIDLIGLKEINENYGREIGDAVLVETTIKVKESLRELDTLFRYRGDEFILLMLDFNDENDVASYIKKIINIINSPLESINNFSISSNIGISLSLKDNTEIEKLIYQANNAMYEANKQGENTFAFYAE